MLISELLNTKCHYSIVRASDDIFKTTAEINGRTIVFTAEAYDDDKWEIAFSEVSKSGKFTFGLSKSGGELEVFSMVRDSIKELIQRYHPRAFFFTADSGKEDTEEKNSRAELYKRLSKRFVPSGYTYSVKTISTGCDEFIFALSK